MILMVHYGTIRCRYRKAPCWQSETERKWTLCIYLQWKKPFEYTKSKIMGIGFDGVVASCGAHIDFHKETVYQVLLTERQVTHALSVLKEYHMPVVLEGPEYVYVNESDFLDDPYVIHLRKELGEHLRNIPTDHSEIQSTK